MIAKTNEEISALREGGRRLSALLRELSTLVRPGVSTQALEDRAREIIAQGGDEAAFLNYKPSGARRPFPAALCVSINDCIVHGIPNEDSYVIQDGDVVTLDAGLKHKGLITDAAVSTIAGKADPEDTRLIQATREALEAGIAAARTGGTLGDIGAAVQRVGNAYGFAYPIELGGHSVGRAVHEEPFIPNFGEEGMGEAIEVGMVLAIEPMFMRGKSAIKLDKDGYSYRTKDGSRAAHSEHTVLITENGPEILTK